MYGFGPTSGSPNDTKGLRDKHRAPPPSSRPRCSLCFTRSTARSRGYTREQFLSDLVDQCEKDIRGAFKAGAKRVSIDFTEGRLACRNDPNNPWTGRKMLAHFINLNNRVLNRFSAEERKNIGIHTCPGGDCDATYSADVDYAELLPSMFKMNAGYFLMQLSSEKDKEYVYKLCGQHSRADAEGVAQVCFIGVINPQNPRVEFARGGARRVDGGLEAHPERTSRVHRRLRLLSLQHRRQAEARLSRRCARHRLPEDHVTGQRYGNGVAEAGHGVESPGEVAAVLPLAITRSFGNAASSVARDYGAAETTPKSFSQIPCYRYQVVAAGRKESIASSR